MSAPGDNWTEVRRSVPAEYVEEVPETYTVWEAYTRQGPTHDGLTIYQGDEAGKEFILVAHQDEHNRAVMQSSEYEKVKSKLEELKAKGTLDDTFSPLK